MSSSEPENGHASLNLSEIGQLGLVAGEGQFPLLIARAAKERDVAVTAFGLRGVTSDQLESEVRAMHWLELGQFEKLIQLFHSEGITKTVMAGRIKHNSIFQLAKMDMRGFKLMAKMINKKANSILGVVIKEFESENIEVLDSTMFLRSCMPGKGLLTPGCRATEEIETDIEFGYDLAKQIAGLDIGQTVVVKNQSVVAVEAMEGTDAAIERAGEIAGEGIVVVKVSKPMQDRRFDVPVIGLTTIHKLIKVKGAALAFSGGETLFFDEKEAVALAESNKIAIIGV